MSLRLVLRPGRLAAGTRVDAARLLPDRFAGLDTAAAARTILPTTAGEAAVGDLFTVAREDGPEESLHLEGDLGCFDRIGSGLASGRLSLDGNAGARAGEGMRGGILMISGSAGDEVGAPLRGLPEGQAGGALIVRGRAGATAGFRMRRGLMALGGAGAAAGAAMVAGTILLFAAPGTGSGAMMRRGTIVVLAPFHPGSMFVRSGRSTAPWLAPWWDALRAVGLPVTAGIEGATFTRFRGDVADGARGEILVREAD
jgi:formylmethanofuran dehydrogenase subunit C